MVVLQSVGYTCSKFKLFKFSLLIGVLLLLACQSDKAIDLDKARKHRYSFAELPKPVRETIKVYISDIDRLESDHAISMDDDIKVNYTRLGGGENWLEDIQHNFHEFTVNGIVMRLRGNQGAPFIIHDSILYYTKELNFMEERYETAIYIGVDISSFLR